MKIVTAAEMNQVDRLTSERHNISAATLMENAGKGVADFIAHRFSHSTTKNIVILCGKGDNGGDGFVVARNLFRRGANPNVFLFAALEDTRGEAADNAATWRDGGGRFQMVRTSQGWSAAKAAVLSADIIVDALLGTGVRGSVEGLYADVINDVNASASAPLGPVIVAVDIPSGLPADSGVPLGPAIKADCTVTFTAPKVGLFEAKAADYVGELIVHKIGSPHELIEELSASKLHWVDAEELKVYAAARKSGGNKGDYGHALIVAGSYGKSGAAVMASWAALRAGAGLVTVAMPDPILSMVAAHTPEVMTEPLPATTAGTLSLAAFDGGRLPNLVEKKRVLAIGPGLSTNDETVKVVHKLLANRNVPIVLDADGLNAFAGRATELRHDAGKLALTPHPGEMSRLANCSITDVQSHRLALALECAKAWNAHVVLKGQATIVASPDGHAFINSTGNPGMGTAGTGDVLTGILAGLTAQFPPKPGSNDWARTLAFGVYLHGLAGDIAYEDFSRAPLLATDLIRALPRAYQRFYEECARG
jgi:ADP-dependent NAD(P)H-hydrate dehydratase / NAD(P)H-hydrate epimerase